MGDYQTAVTVCTNCMSVLEGWADTCNTCNTDEYVMDRQENEEII